MDRLFICFATLGDAGVVPSGRYHRSSIAAQPTNQHVRSPYLDACGDFIHPEKRVGVPESHHFGRVDIYIYTYRGDN